MEILKVYEVTIVGEASPLCPISEKNQLYKKVQRGRSTYYGMYFFLAWYGGGAVPPANQLSSPFPASLFFAERLMLRMTPM